MTQRYGDFVLYRPPLKASTVLLWLGPLLLPCPPPPKPSPVCSPMLSLLRRVKR
jgi:hypothetical protein